MDRLRLLALVSLLALPSLAHADIAPEPPPAQQRSSAGYHLPPDQYQRAVDYSRARYRLYFLNAGYGFLLLGLLLRGRVAARYRRWAERVSRVRFVQTLVFIPLLILTLTILSLPLAIYSQQLSRAYDQSVQSWASWLVDLGKEQLISIVIGTLLAWLLYAVIRRSPGRWWFYFWLASIPILIFLLFLAPTVIEPMFYKFDPLAATQPALADDLERVVAHAGLSIPKERMFEMQASEKVKSINAYVSGFGASQRVVVWDTTIAKATSPQILFVFGHEMGHYVLGHIYKGIAFGLIGLFVCLYLGFRGMEWAIARWGIAWQIRDSADLASLPLLLLILSVASFVASPISAAFSRYQEHQADIYGIEVIHGLVPDGAQAAAGAFQVLGEVDLADPAPSTFIKLWLYDHPPLGERIDFVRGYDPWSQGRSPEFVK
jgi:Zn-dependent protease with chaperone function